MENFVSEGGALTILGTDVRFDPTDLLQGVFIANSAGTTVRQTNIVLNEPSRIICMATLPALVTPNDVEFTLSVASKYTTNGSVRTGVYQNYIRTTNVPAGLNLNLFVIGGDAGVALESIAGLSGPAKFKARIRTDGVLVFAAAWGTSPLVYGNEYECRENGIVPVIPDEGGISLSVTDYEGFYERLISRSKYIEEIVDFGSGT